jgi:hypothetical protein
VTPSYYPARPRSNQPGLDLTLLGDAAAKPVHAAKLLDCLVEPPQRAVVSAPEELGLQAVSHELPGDRVDALRARPRTRADDAIEAPAAEEQSDAVL